MIEKQACRLSIDGSFWLPPSCGGGPAQRHRDGPDASETGFAFGPDWINLQLDPRLRDGRGRREENQNAKA